MDPENVTTSRRGFLGHVAGAYLAAGALTIAGAAADPVHEAIDRHWDLFRSACGSPSDAELDELVERQISALHAVLDTVPTTDAGMLAYLDHLASEPGFSKCLASEAEFDAICATFRRFIAARAG